MHRYLPLTAVGVLLGLTPTVIASASPSIVDLSTDHLQYSDYHNASPGAQSLLDAIDSSTDSIRSVIILERGQIVTSYIRDDIDVSDTYNIYSATKSFMSIIVGMLIDDGSLSLDDTLGDVFDNSTVVWANVRETDYIQSVTIEEILTMTSGLVNPSVTSEAYSNVDWEDPTSYIENLSGVHNYGGGDLIDSLNYLEVKESGRGDFDYILMSQILGYVVLKRSGLSPLEFATERILPLIGIDPDAMEWDENDDGMQHSFSGMRLNADQMARFGQLILQRGLAGPDSRVVSEDYVEMALSSQVDASSFFPGMSYGYLFWKIDGTMMGMGSMDCAQGFGGQTICINKELERVSVLQMDVGLSDQDYGMTMIGLAITAFSPATSFDGSGDDERGTTEGDDASSSNFVRLSTGSMLIAAIISALVVQ